MKTYSKIILIITVCLTIISCSTEENEDVLQSNDNNVLVDAKADFLGELPNTSNLSREMYFATTCLRGGKNYRMVRGTKITIASSYLYTLQTDGNFVCYNLKKAGPNPDNKYDFPVWATNTQNKAVEYIYFQEDGNMVAYNADLSKVIWSSNTNFPCTPNSEDYHYFKLKENGDLTIKSNINYVTENLYTAKSMMPVTYPENFE